MFTQTAINHHSYANRFGLPRWLPKTQQLVWLVGALEELAHEQQAEPEPTSDVKPATSRQAAAIKASRKHTANRRQRTHARTEMRTAMRNWEPGQEEDEQAKVEAEAEYWQWWTVGRREHLVMQPKFLTTMAIAIKAWRTRKKVDDIHEAYADTIVRWQDANSMRFEHPSPANQRAENTALSQLRDFYNIEFNTWRIEQTEYIDADGCYRLCKDHAEGAARMSLDLKLQTRVWEKPEVVQDRWTDFLQYEREYTKLSEWRWLLLRNTARKVNQHAA